MQLTAKVLVALLAVYSIWSSTYLAMRYAVEFFPPFLLGGLRYTTAGLILWALLAARGTPLPSYKQWFLSVPLGALMFGAGNGLVGLALSTKAVSSGVAAVVCATMPICAAVLLLAWREYPRGRDWIGLGLGFAGVVILTWSAGFENRSATEFYLLLVAPPAWALGSILARKLPLAAGLMSAATQMVTGGLVMLALAPLWGERWPTTVSPRAWASLAYLMVFGSLIAFSAYTYLLKHARPALAMSYAYVNPVLAVLLGAFLANESLGLQVSLATLLIVGGVVTVVKG